MKFIYLIFVDFLLKRYRAEEQLSRFLKIMRFCPEAVITNEVVNDPHIWGIQPDVISMIVVVVSLADGCSNWSVLQGKPTQEGSECWLQSTPAFSISTCLFYCSKAQDCGKHCWCMFCFFLGCCFAINVWFLSPFPLYTHECQHNFVVRGNLEHMLPTLTAAFPLCDDLWSHALFNLL